ncbi:GTPase IMAP family member 7-like [Brienomyrus brachyistius]|uniref:GTPase IMAP family member 7-like n=1 Tax=Brienomyrus brachyistius TaxID=42636 RepID=UPI0020B3039B|nr:GTPase IMAP family member 7-like [Brienomyrus brachyistius]
MAKGRKPPKFYRLPQLRIVLLGERGAGKSSAGNVILGREEFECGRETQVCVRKRAEKDGRQVSVVDTPGWDGSTLDVPESLHGELVRSMTMCPSGPHAILLVIPATWSLFTETQKRAAEGCLRLFGERIWSHALVLFTKGGKIGREALEEQVKGRGAHLQGLLERCGGRCHFLSDRKPWREDQVTELLDRIDEMTVANDGWHFRIDPSPGAERDPGRPAGEGRLRERLGEMEREMEEMRWRCEQKVKEKEEELKRDFEETWRRRERELREEMGKGGEERGLTREREARKEPPHVIWREGPAEKPLGGAGDLLTPVQKRPGGPRAGECRAGDTGRGFRPSTCSLGRYGGLAVVALGVGVGAVVGVIAGALKGMARGAAVGAVIGGVTGGQVVTFLRTRLGVWEVRDT